ncbi:MAG TPA: hypothetical protein VM716_11840 [Gemmatimonadales bacterium]|nr:hypothetical protein [Gemmatimonadales bacterium]
MRIARALLVIACVAGPLRAQALHPAAAVSVVTPRVHSTTGEFSGTAFLGEGSVTLGRLSLDVSYLQGKLDPAPTPAGNTSRDLIEGAVLLGLHPTGWLTLAGGPHARAYALGGGVTQRWLFWELRARAATAFVGSAARGYVELWRALSADANVPERFDHAQGAEAGMIVRLARAPVEARLGYRIDHAVLGGGARLETVDGMVIGVGLRWR